MSAVWERSPAGASQLLVLLAIADNADDEGLAWPSMELIARKARMSERQVRRIVKELEASGELTVTKKRRGSSTINVYRVIPGGQDDRLPDEGTRTDQVAHPDIAVSAEPSLEPPGAGEANASPAHAPNAKRKPRARDPVWDTLVEVFSEAPPPGTSEHGRWNRAARDLRAHGATPATIRQAAATYKTHPSFKDCVMTVTAIAANYRTLIAANFATESRVDRLRRLRGEAA